MFNQAVGGSTLNTLRGILRAWLVPDLGALPRSPSDREGTGGTLDRDAPRGAPSGPSGVEEFHSGKRRES